jgi:hypothetical protein
MPGNRLEPAKLRNLNQSPALHSGGGLLALLVTTILGVYQPWGMTPHGRRKRDTAVVRDYLSTAAHVAIEHPSHYHVSAT